VVYEFEGIHDRVPEMLEMIAAWLRQCAEYALEQIALHTEDGWSIISVIVHEISAGDLIEQLTTEGHVGLAESIATLVTEHGVREGLRLAGVAYT